MRKIFYLVTLLVSLTAHAQVSILEVDTIRVRPPIEAWVKLTCIGTITPVNSPLGIQLGPIATYFVQANIDEPFPSIFDLRNRNSDFFHHITGHCTETRLAKVNLSGFTGVWLDWGTDYSYTKLEIGESFIYDNQCRALGRPCSYSKQCCSSKRQSVTCSKATNSCERSSRSSLPVEINR